jgi:Bacterial Ig domain
MGMRRIVLLLASMALAMIFGSGVALADSPTTKEDCKHGGYAKYGFKNQGQCIKAVKLPPPADTTPPEIHFGTDCPRDGSVSSSYSCVFHSNEPVQFTCAFGLWPNDPASFEPCSYSGDPIQGAFLFDPSQYEGEKLELTVRAVDASGNTNELPTSWTVDTVSPTVDITSGPEDGATINTDTVSFGWSASDNREVAEVQCYIQTISGGTTIFVDDSTGPEDYLCGGTRYTGASRSPATFSNLPDGEYKFVVLAMDASGQIVSAQRGFTVDTTP